MTAPALRSFDHGLRPRPRCIISNQSFICPRRSCRIFPHDLDPVIPSSPGAGTVCCTTLHSRVKEGIMNSQVSRRKLLKTIGAATLISPSPARSGAPDLPREGPVTPHICLEINGRLAAASSDESTVAPQKICSPGRGGVGIFFPSNSLPEYRLPLAGPDVAPYRAQNSFCHTLPRLAPPSGNIKDPAVGRLFC